jgi:hypothetical protein
LPSAALYQLVCAQRRRLKHIYFKDAYRSSIGMFFVREEARRVKAATKENCFLTFNVWTQAAQLTFSVGVKGAESVHPRSHQHLTLIMHACRQMRAKKCGRGVRARELKRDELV